MAVLLRTVPVLRDETNAIPKYMDSVKRGKKEYVFSGDKGCIYRKRMAIARMLRIELCYEATVMGK
ncbi:unnamed protein product [Dovyalis caffra]|uniref:Uncharacterized protein n=1 Tax=Dovyalis caffra TaxID=77055 RepID=A0AAV1SQS4_9ROSI|nr:unnamed protein product [Dovyalis caffra]